MLKARFSHPGMVEVGTFAVGSHLGKSVKGNTPLPSRSGTSWYNCTCKIPTPFGISIWLGDTASGIYSCMDHALECVCVEELK